MPEQSNNPLNFWQELKRRKVIRVIPVYAAAAFILLELVDIISEPFGLPSWTLKFIFVLLCIGFVISVILSWVYDITPGGVQKTKPAKEFQRAGKTTTSNAWKITTYVSLVVIAALIVLQIVGGRNQISELIELEKSIAVLPFDNLSSDEEQAWFSDGITDIIINQLSKITDYRVLGRTSTLKYREGDKSISEIGEELGVNFIIEGTVQRIEDNVRISVQLIRVINEDHIWADLYDRQWKDIFFIQSDIAQNVAEELSTELSPEVIEKIEKKSTKNLIAYDLYLHGRYYWNQRTEEGVKKSMDYFEQAIEFDENYALAYSGLADAYFICGEWNYLVGDSAFIKARSLALQAISLDNNIAEAYATLALIAEYFESDYELAKLFYNQALLVNPHYPPANQWYALFLTSMGKFEEAFTYMKMAQELDPKSAIISYASGLMYYYAQEYDEALIQLEKTLKIDPELPPTRSTMLMCYLQKGLYKEVIKEYENILNGNPLLVGYIQNATDILENDGINGLINYIIDLELQTSNPDRGLLPILYATIGSRNKALDILEYNVKERITDFVFINVEPAYMDLHSEPRFKALLERIGM